jgi:hypothetical protein
VASVTPDRAISGVRAEQRASCTGLRGREQQLQSRAKPTQPRRRASHPTGRSAVHAPSSERPVPLKLPGESQSSIDRERSRRGCGGERHTRASHPTGRSAECAPSSERPVPLKLPRESKSSFDRERTDAAEAASVTSDRAISGARAEQRAACAAQASESESKSNIDRERSRHSRGGEHHTRQGDQRGTRRAAAASVTPDRAISGARAEQQAACAAQAFEREPEQLRSRA